jgi:hypothetical protein
MRGRRKQRIRLLALIAALVVAGCAVPGYNPPLGDQVSPNRGGSSAPDGGSSM